MTRECHARFCERRRGKLPPPTHHRLIHHSDWNIEMNTDGHPDYIPPPWLDAERKPRHNNTHHPIRPG